MYFHINVTNIENTILKNALLFKLNASTIKYKPKEYI